MSRRVGVGAAFATIAAALAVGVGASATTAPVSVAPAQAPTLRELVGRRLVVSFRGTRASPALLARIRRGEVGGVIIFGANVRSLAQVRELTETVHAAAASAGRRVLVMVDQEGASVRRFHSLPPFRSAQQLGALTPTQVRQEGRATGAALRALGVDVDLAPVADVPRVVGAFIEAQGRAFSRDPGVVSTAAAAFAAGLRDRDVLAAVKHFPGLGGAVRNTDLAAVRIDGSRAEHAADLVPFRRLVDDGVPLVMISSAVYPAYGGAPALWSAPVHALLRRELGFQGVVISDALEPVARSRGRSLERVSILAARAGTDMLLFAGDERASARVYDTLVAAARDGSLSRAALERSYRRIGALSPSR